MNSVLEGKISDSLLDKEVEGGEKIRDVKETNNKNIPSLSFVTPSFQEFCLPYKFCPYLLKNFSAV